MNINQSQVRLLKNEKITESSKWIYVADFNITKKDDGTLKSTARLDCEIEDLKYLTEKGASVAILAHKGRFKDKDTEDLDYLVRYLADKLGKSEGKEVFYYPENNSLRAQQFAKGLKSGQVAIMGNTRKNPGEETNNIILAKQFAQYGKFVAIGGFGKAHREQSSNHGILNYLPGYLTESQAREMKNLENWAGKNEDRFSIAVLGGIKKEKITTGLKGFIEIYDKIMPGGIVLNSIFASKGIEIGESLIKDSGKHYIDFVKKIMDGENKDKIIVPEKVIIAKYEDEGFYGIDERDIEKGVPKGYMIVDYLMNNEGMEILDRLIEKQGRIVIAGTPGISTAGFKKATDSIINKINGKEVEGIVLGGDSASEIKYSGKTSTGGGSALYYVSCGTTPVFEKLKENLIEFG